MPPLQLFKLDERLDPAGPTFQRIVDEAKGMIGRYCPEWTDHNVSDPGVALIELFAWMTETLLYRVNQVPDRMYVQFLELLGMRLEPPRAATTPVTFYLAAPLGDPHVDPVTLDAGTEVATLRTELLEPLVFTTREAHTLRAPVIQDQLAYLQRASGWQTYDLRHLEAGRPLVLFNEPPALNDAFCLPLAEDHSQYVLALNLTCTKARPQRLQPDNPPRVFEVSTGQDRWAECVVESDGTRGFTEAHGEIVLRLPDMALAEYHGRSAYWLRCRYHVRSDNNEYGRSPALEGLRLETRGYTACAYHEAVAEEELLGMSDGTPGQRFTLRHTPVLERAPEREHLVVVTPEGVIVPWQEVPHFGDSHEDRHYTLDSASGLVTLAPWLLQPDGRFYRLGQVPPRGSRVIFRRYRYGGGRVEVGPQAISVLKTSNPYVRRVINWRAPEGGRDLQRLEDAVLRSVPDYLRTRERAVTASDYEHLAGRVRGVARARCLAPGAQPGAGEPRPGQVVLSVLPTPGVDSVEPGPEEVAAEGEGGDLQRDVAAYLADRRLLGTALVVRAPSFTRVTVTAQLRVADATGLAVPADLAQQAEVALYRFLSPYIGGAAGAGWPFGRELYRRELIILLERLPAVESVDELTIQSEPVLSGGAGTPTTGASVVRLPADGLFVSGRHRVTVDRKR